MTTESAGQGPALSEGLGLAPDRAGQPRMMTIIDGAQEDETGHWYSPTAVRDLLAAERERCALLCEDIADRHLRSGRYVSTVADHSVRVGDEWEADNHSRAVAWA